MTIGPDGITLRWPLGSAEERYSGTWIAWSAVRDADPDMFPPELRLTDGRTVFISRERQAELAVALTAAQVPVRKRGDVWSNLLEPFLDIDYDEVTRAGCESKLHAWGFDDQEIKQIRDRVWDWMTALTLATSEWGNYGHHDVLLAAGNLPAERYLAFRAWADTIAARAP
ncbi:hypothetical protein [Couchioplanes caeruleus]|uniref:hypothetical protein n=1 Tax=Couchioplanes caeruleus TaxID=56438 RepID=UPI0011CE5EA9|nr:hypothetical protein [Couchioplanes caeruleus]